MSEGDTESDGPPRGPPCADAGCSAPPYRAEIAARRRESVIAARSRSPTPLARAVAARAAPTPPQLPAPSTGRSTRVRTAGVPQPPSCMRARALRDPVGARRGKGNAATSGTLFFFFFGGGQTARGWDFALRNLLFGPFSPAKRSQRAPDQPDPRRDSRTPLESFFSLFFFSLSLQGGLSGGCMGWARVCADGVGTSDIDPVINP